MKLVQFLYDEMPHWGIISEAKEQILTLQDNKSQFYSFDEVISSFFKAKQNGFVDAEKIALCNVTLLPPVLPTKNVLCIGKNYHDHILEFDGSDEDIENIKKHPIFFSKATSAIVATDTPIKLHKEVTNSVDYEAELAVVIGKRGVNISREDALTHVYGYTILNDITARDLQQIHQQWLRGKSLDTHCPIGPWVVTKDEIEDPQNLAIQSIINGEVRQNSNTKHMIHTVADLIMHLSKGMTLEVGDIIATGTPVGVGMGFDPPKFLKSGDRVEIVIENIGSLVNVVE